MKTKKLALCTVLFFILLLLISTLILPIRAAETQNFVNTPYLNTQKLPDNTTIMPFGNATVVIKELQNNGYKFILVSQDGKNTTFEIVNRKISNQTSIQKSVNPNSVLTERVVLVNGKEAYKLPINDQIASQPAKDSTNPNMLLDATYYYWDGVYYGQGGGFQYPHPDRGTYNIQTFNDELVSGNQLYHIQFSDSKSTALADATAAEFGLAAGAEIAGAGLFDPIADIIGTAVGVAVTAFISVWLGDVFLDESDCMWWWWSHAYEDWLHQNEGYLLFLFAMDPALAMGVINDGFIAYGYLRIGNIPFWDAVGAGNPSPPPDPYYVSSITHTQAYGYGAVNNQNGLTGNSNDGSYVQLWGGNYNDGGQIVGWMNQEAHGHIYLYGHSGDGYYTHLYVYVSYNNNNDWTQTSVQTVSGTNDRWIDCGSYSGNFRYIAIVGIDNNGMSANIFLDSVKVQP